MTNFSFLTDLMQSGPIAAVLLGTGLSFAATALGAAVVFVPMSQQRARKFQPLAMGFAAGLFSFIVWTFMPPNPVTAFVFTPTAAPGNFWGLVICFVPRILTGVVASLMFKLLSRLLDGKKGATGVIYAVSGVLGSLTNTLLVMGGIYVFFGKSYATAMDISFNLLLGIIGTTILTNGVLEAIVGGLVACGVCIPMKKMMRRTLPL